MPAPRKPEFVAIVNLRINKQACSHFEYTLNLAWPFCPLFLSFHINL